MNTDISHVKFFGEHDVPLEMHKARIVQPLTLLPIEERFKKNAKAFNNAHLLKSEDVYLDMLTDSGVNAMSDAQLSAMMVADDAYAGSASFYKLEENAKEIFGMKYFLPAHQGRACEHLLCKVFVDEGDTVVTNYHFTTFRAHVLNVGATVYEAIDEDAFVVDSETPFKGDVDLDKLEAIIDKLTPAKIPFLRIELGTNLIGGQPVSIGNIKAAATICHQKGIMTVCDASLLSDNVYFNKLKEEIYKDHQVWELIKEISDCFDIIYFSARKLTSSRGGGLMFRNEPEYIKVRDLLPLYEGFLTYGGISSREIEAMSIGLVETLDWNFISQGPIFINHMVNMLKALNIPVITPAGGLGVHLDARAFLPNIPPTMYPGAALHCALYIAAGIRGTERGTLSEDRGKDGKEKIADLELLRLALPRRVFTLSQIEFAVDRINWLYVNSDLIGGLEFEDEPETLRFFFGKLKPIGDWQKKLVKQFKRDFGESL
ncbi:MAG: tryptophanase [Eubacteriaceae bacterium]|nr:tryptophanase [Eubacteriaceae bacterium]